MLTRDWCLGVSTYTQNKTKMFYCQDCPLESDSAPWFVNHTRSIGMERWPDVFSARCKPSRPRFSPFHQIKWIRYPWNMKNSFVYSPPGGCNRSPLSSPIHRGTAGRAQAVLSPTMRWCRRHFIYSVAKMTKMMKVTKARVLKVKAKVML